jgi:hypothetical protein
VLLDVAVTSKSCEGDMSAVVTPLVFGIDGWQDYDNTDDDSISDVEESSCSLSLNPTEEAVKLIYHRKFDWTICESEDGLVLPISDSSDCNQDNEFSHSCEKGFYDISMLTGGCYNYSMEDFVHPDVKLESMLNEHHRQRLIANQISCGSVHQAAFYSI